MDKTVTQENIDELVDNLQMYKYVCAVDENELGPLKSVPKIEADVETKNITIYEVGSDPQASIIVKNNVKLTIESEDMDAAIALVEVFKKGDNVFDSTKKKIITLVPVPSDANAKTITFPNAYLQPGFTPTFEDGEEPNSVSLTFICRPDTTSGQPFIYNIGE